MNDKSTKCNHNFKIVRGQQRQYVYKKVCFDCGEVSEMDWEKEFDEQFPRSIEISDRPGAFVVLQSEGEHERRKSFIRTAIQKAIAQERERNKVTGETSDGYHTFNELYEFRKVFNAVLFNEWYAQGKYSVHKSEKHADGEPCFGGGWFIVMATLPTGQISNHYEMKDWDLFKCEERKRADTWDGHEAKDVIDRLLHITTNNHE